jgi:hypothetical protein
MLDEINGTYDELNPRRVCLQCGQNEVARPKKFCESCRHLRLLGAVRRYQDRKRGVTRDYSKYGLSADYKPREHKKPVSPSG